MVDDDGLANAVNLRNNAFVEVFSAVDLEHAARLVLGIDDDEEHGPTWQSSAAHATVHEAVTRLVSALGVEHTEHDSPSIEEGPTATPPPRGRIPAYNQQPQRTIPSGHSPSIEGPTVFPSRRHKRQRPGNIAHQLSPSNAVGPLNRVRRRKANHDNPDDAGATRSKRVRSSTDSTTTPPVLSGLLTMPPKATKAKIPSPVQDRGAEGISGDVLDVLPMVAEQRAAMNLGPRSYPCVFSNYSQPPYLEAKTVRWHLQVVPRLTFEQSFAKVPSVLPNRHVRLVSYDADQQANIEDIDAAFPEAAQQGRTVFTTALEASHQTNGMTTIHQR